MMQKGVDRRRFLAYSGAALPWIMPRSSRGRAVTANEQIGLGIIGMGIRARNMMTGYFLKDDRVRVLAVCDVDQSRREHYKQVVDKHYGNEDCSAYVDYSEILEREDIDAVVITTPDHWHATQAIHAAKAGKDIYCEKPLTHTLLESQLIIEAVRKYKRVFQTGSQQRSEYQHRFVKAVEYVRNGRIGKLLTVHVGVGDPPKGCQLSEEEMEPGLDWSRWLGPAAMRPYHSDLSPRGIHNHYPRWRAYWDYCGGYLADMGAHHFDIAQWALDADRSGPIALTPARDGDLTRGAVLQYANGVDVVHGGPNGVTFIGTKGSIQVDRGRLTSTPENLFETPIEEGEWRLPRNPSHPDDWIQCIHSRQAPICDEEVGARTAAVCQLVNLSYRLQRRLLWDPAQWRFKQDPTANNWLDYQRRDAFALPEV